MAWRVSRSRLAIRAASVRRSWRARWPRGPTSTWSSTVTPGCWRGRRAWPAWRRPRPTGIHAVTSLGPGDVAAGQTERRGGTGAARVPRRGDDGRAGGRGRGPGDGADLEAVDRARRLPVPRPHRVPGVARRRAREFAMMLAGPKLRVTVATTHVPLRDVAGLLTADGIASTIWLTRRGAGAALRHRGAAGGGRGAEPARRRGRALRRRGRAPGPPRRSQRRARASRRRAWPREISGPHVPDVVFRDAAAGASTPSWRCTTTRA